MHLSNEDSRLVQYTLHYTVTEVDQDISIKNNIKWTASFVEIRIERFNIKSLEMSTEGSEVIFQLVNSMSNTVVFTSLFTDSMQFNPSRVNVNLEASEVVTDSCSGPIMFETLTRFICVLTSKGNLRG